jgi:tetratricopeptide (TPR) repeat protein
LRSINFYTVILPRPLKFVVLTKSKHKLAAIMFSDIVGYTALMGKDEQKALAILYQNRQIHNSCINNHGGKMLKEMGDGILAQFNSAADAVLCAVEIQQMARARIDGKLRIGIHLGDIVVEQSDVFGDGVNIASRLQSIADPGGIYISESVQKAIRSRNDIQTKYLAEVALKNVDSGYLQAMERMAEAYIIKMDTSYVTPWQIATLFVRAGNKEEAINWLEKAYKEKDPNMPYISTDPIFDIIYNEPRFQELLRKMNLPQQEMKELVQSPLF